MIERSPSGASTALDGDDDALAMMSAHSVDYVENLYSEYIDDPSQVPDAWRRFFESYDESPAAAGRLGPSFHSGSVFNPTTPVDGHGAPSSQELRAERLQERVDMLVRVYRVRGHMLAKIDPLGLPRQVQPELNLEYYGFTESDLDRPISTTTIQGENVRTIRELHHRLKNTYCRFIGAQFMHIDDLEVRDWLTKRMEGSENRLSLSRDVQFRILTRLTDAVIFEQFVRKKFVGAKTFSLEGGESLIPLLDLAIEKASEQGVDAMVLGMAHRGRLNVLANILGKKPEQIFLEFEGAQYPPNGSGGDVKYHLGHHGFFHTSHGKRVHLSLCFNPSHLEYVNPVALGRTRAKQERAGRKGRRRKMCVLIHGDAAFAGEGVVQETLNLSELPGYSVGGTLHVVVNNQIGFTTPPEEGRSSTYATDIAKMLQIPIFHVNGEDPEAVAQVVELAMDFRHKFHRDVVIDMYCYRRWGHNEGDEPSFTQPRMYGEVDRRATVREGYLEHLLKLGEVTREEADKIAEQRRQHLEKEFSRARQGEATIRSSKLESVWKNYSGGLEPHNDEPHTGLERQAAGDLLHQIARTPEGFHVHRKLKRWLEGRRQMAAGKTPLDWAAAEALAFGALAVDGVRVRLTGQDSERGTFSQRHAVLHDVENGSVCMPLKNLTPDQAPVDIINSPLSEAGVMGYEYGYSLDCPQGLLGWEAQFGDFWNAAQVIVDQFLASAEEKWQRLSGLVLLLPHGFEGQGPEHSSARLERFLMLAAQDNMQIAYPSTPAQYFHLLRRQGLRKWRKPLIVLTPKSLLRHRECVSTLEEIAEGRFQRVIGDAQVDGSSPVERVLLCSGKIYYDLVEKREQTGRDDVAIVRLEQFYPFRESELADVLSAYPDETPVYWVQEEPENMGAWHFLKVRYCERLLGRYPLHSVARRPAASPATGWLAAHKEQQRQLLAQAFGETDEVDDRVVARDDACAM